MSELRAFLGLVMYYGKFIKNLSSLSAPLNQLLRKETKWKWSDHCEEKFKALKNALISAEVLCHYNLVLPLGLACDASAVGIGAVIFHTLSDGSEKPIAYASRTLSKIRGKLLSNQKGSSGYHLWT